MENALYDACTELRFNVTIFPIGTCIEEGRLQEDEKISENLYRFEK